MLSLIYAGGVVILAIALGSLYSNSHLGFIIIGGAAVLYAVVVGSYNAVVRRKQ